MVKIKQSLRLNRALKLAFLLVFIVAVAELSGSSYFDGWAAPYYFHHKPKGAGNNIGVADGNIVDSFLYTLADPSFKVKIRNLTHESFEEFRRKKFGTPAVSKNANNNTNKYAQAIIKSLEYLKKLESLPHHNQLDLFIKQLSRVKRFERNSKLRAIMDKTINRFTVTVGFSNTVHHSKKYQSTTNSKHNVTMIFNTLNEITNVESLIEDIGNNIHLEWAKNSKLLVAITANNAKKFSAKLHNLKTILPTFDWLVVPDSLNHTLTATLVYIALRTSTKYLLFTRRLRKMDPKFDMSEFLGPLHKRTTDIVAGTVILKSGEWKIGCYQFRLIWSQFTIHTGYDKHRNDVLVQCDATDSPFAISKSMALSLLLGEDGQGKSPSGNINKIKIGKFPSDDSVYLQFFLTARLRKDYIIKTYLPTLFYVEDSDEETVTNSQSAMPQTRHQWQQFARRNDISDIRTPNGHHFEFTWQEANVRNCVSSPKSNMMKSRACMRYLHKLLIDSYRLFDRLGYQYSTEDGSGLGATKLHDTLPWELDHDFSFRTQNITDLMRHQSDFEKIGIYLVPEIDDKPCMNSTKETSTWRCGYVALRGRFWRLEAWGQRILPSDVYRPDTILPVYKDMYLESRIVGVNFTSIRIGDFWSQTVANPGYYARARYGLDSLRHAQHWAVTGGETSWQQYSTATHFEPCPDEGHHLCLNQYLADGNIQFQRP